MGRKSRALTIGLLASSLCSMEAPSAVETLQPVAYQAPSTGTSSPTIQDQVAFRLAFGRAPSAKEATASEKLVRAHGLPLLCRVLFNANEFVFVD